MADRYATGNGTDRTRDYASDERVIEFVTENARESLRYNQTLFSKIQGFYDTYRGVWRGEGSRFRNQITIPFTFAMIQSNVARKVQGLFGQRYPVGFEGYAPEDEQRAKKNEALMAAQFKDAGSLRRAIDFFLSGDICGTAIARIGWKTTQRKNRVRRRVSLAPGLDVPVWEEDPRAILFDGPNWEVVDRLDYWQQPTIKCIDEGWGIHRYYLDYDDLLEDANSDNSYFDKPAVLRLAQIPLAEAAQEQYNARRMTFRNEMDYQARVRARFSKPVEIWEFHGLVPREFARDGIRDRCIAVANGRIVVKNYPGILGNGQKPFLADTPMRDPYSFDGIGKAEVAYGPQRTADRLNNQKLDALDILIDPQVVVRSDANLNMQHLFTRAGRILTVDGNPSEVFQPMQMNMQGLSAAYAEISQLFQFMQLGTGETESIMGLAGPSRETARGFLGRQENALTRLALETAVGGEFVEDLANGFRHMDRLWLTMPMEVKILGSLATVNPTTGMPYAPETYTVDYDDLAPDYRARAVGPTQMIGRGVRQQNLVALLQMMSANPALLQLVNWANFARQAFDLFDFRNVNELLVSQVPAVNQLAAQTGQSPQAVASAVSQPLEQMNPQVLGQLSGMQAPEPLMAAGMFQ